MLGGGVGVGRGWMNNADEENKITTKWKWLNVKGQGKKIGL